MINSIFIFWREPLKVYLTTFCWNVCQEWQFLNVYNVYLLYIYYFCDILFFNNDDCRFLIYVKVKNLKTWRSKVSMRLKSSKPLKTLEWKRFRILTDSRINSIINEKISSKCKKKTCWILEDKPIKFTEGEFQKVKNLKLRRIRVLTY